MLNRLTIKQRLALFISIFVVFQAILTAAIFNNLATTEHHIESIVEHDMPVVELVTSITEHQLEQEILFEKAFRSALEFDTEPKAKQHFADTVGAYFRLN